VYPSTRSTIQPIMGLVNYVIGKLHLKKQTKLFDSVFTSGQKPNTLVEILLVVNGVDHPFSMKKNKTI